ncbi:MAG: hypothetical protein ABI406_17735 [Ktedonobacteraceae bacterium]
MAARIDQPMRGESTARRPLWLSILAGFSLLLGIVTAIPQFYYVLFALHLVTIGPNSNLLGQVWYSYILNGDNSYQKVDPGVLAGAVEDAFLLGPLYLATGIGLLLRRPWVIPVGLITGAMIFYAIVGFFLGDIFAGLPSVTNGVSYWASNLPYLLYPLWLVPVLLFQRSLFIRKEPDKR